MIVYNNLNGVYIYIYTCIYIHSYIIVYSGIWLYVIVHYNILWLAVR